MPRPKQVSGALYRKWQQATDSLSTFRELGAKCKRYAAGKQWTEEEIELLRRRNQPAIVYNQIAPLRRHVISLFEAMKRTITVLPRSSNDTDKAWMMAQVINAIFDVNNVDSKRLWIARDAFDTGIGWWTVQRGQLLTKDPIEVDYVPWDEMIWDVSAKRMDLDDAAFVARIKWLPMETVRSAFPEYRKAIEECLNNPQWGDNIGGDSIPRVDSYGRVSSRTPWADMTRDMVQVMEWWEYRYEQMPCLVSGDMLVPFDEDLHGTLVANGAQLVDAPVRVPYILFICGPWVLFEGRTHYRHFNFPFVPVVFDWDDANHVPRGLVADLIDPQDEVNKRRSKAIHFLNMNQVVMDEGAVSNVDELREELADPEGIIIKRPNRNFEVLRNLELAKGHFEMMVEALNEIRTVSGVFQDAVGQPTNARTGAAIQARQQGTQTSLVFFFSNMMQGERKMATMAMDLVRQFYRAPRVFRITDERGQAAFIELNKPVQDPLTGEVIVENSLQSLQADLVVAYRAPMATERQAMAQHVTEVMKAAPPQVQSALIDLWLDLMDVPRKDEIRQRMAAAAQMASAIQMPGQLGGQNVPGAIPIRGPARPGPGAGPGAGARPATAPGPRPAR